ncbi:hypothetical protein PMIN06_003152 [Paraphaeosphaeria minitans]
MRRGGVHRSRADFQQASDPVTQVGWVPLYYSTIQTCETENFTSNSTFKSSEVGMCVPSSTRPKAHRQSQSHALGSPQVHDYPSQRLARKMVFMRPWGGA